MNILGISANFHDSACCLIQDGKLVSAVSEERFSRLKNDARLPIRAFRYCLENSGLSITDVDCFAYYENPYKKLSRQLSSNFKHSVYNDLTWLDCKKPFQDIREVLGYEGEIKYYDHHLSHAAGSYFFSGFDNAAILTLDGVGEWATITFGVARGSSIDLFNEVCYPNSVGLLYSTITNFLGFKVLSGEYKVMGLAPYGQLKYVNKLYELYSLSGGSDFILNMNYFDFDQSERMYTDELIELIGFFPRQPESKIEQKHMDLARSLQFVLEEIIIQLVTKLKIQIDSPNLCMSGGVALNCVANQAIRKTALFKNMFIAPAAGDAGSALGAAVLAYIEMEGKRHSNEQLQHVYLGPKYSSEDIYHLLLSMELDFLDFRANQESLLNKVVDYIACGKIVAWFHGRMEFGPRALGARSIIADPRDPTIRDRLNVLVKKREAFRPFAPAILEEKAAEHIELDIASPFMLETTRVISTLSLPAITHVDGSCRPQTVAQKSNPRFHALLSIFYQRTGCPILVNTSFNVRDEPIVCTPLDALKCFGNSGIDILVLEDFIIDRERLPELFFIMAKRQFDSEKLSHDFFKGESMESAYTFV